MFCHEIGQDLHIQVVRESTSFQTVENRYYLEKGSVFRQGSVPRRNQPGTNAVSKWKIEHVPTMPRSIRIVSLCEGFSSEQHRQMRDDWSKTTQHEEVRFEKAIEKLQRSELVVLLFSVKNTKYCRKIKFFLFASLSGCVFKLRIRIPDPQWMWIYADQNSK